jgi:uncharacterized protein (DUF736 family)
MAGTYIYIGAAWKKPGKDGKPFLSFSLDIDKITGLVDLTQQNVKLNATLYENTKKTKPTQPDYNLVVRKDEEIP